MIKWTTPTLKCTIPNDLVFDYLIITFMQNQNNTKIEKRIEYSDVEDGSFEITLSQEETGNFYKNIGIEVQLNLMQGETRLATNIVELVITKNLHDEEIE